MPAVAWLVTPLTAATCVILLGLKVCPGSTASNFAGVPMVIVKLCELRLVAKPSDEAVILRLWLTPGVTGLMLTVADPELKVPSTVGVFGSFIEVTVKVPLTLGFTLKYESTAFTVALKFALVLVL